MLAHRWIYILIVWLQVATFAFAQVEMQGRVRLQVKLSRDSIEGVNSLFALYDTLIEDETLNQRLRDGFMAQKQRLGASLEPSLGFVYLDEIGRHFLVTGANISTFGDFASAEIWRGNAFRKLGEAFVIYRDVETDLAVYLLSDDVRPLTAGTKFAVENLMNVRSVFGYTSSEILPVERVLSMIQEELTGEDDPFLYGSPLLNWRGDLLGMYLGGGVAVDTVALQETIQQAIRIRPRSTEGALSRASLRFVNAMMSENFDAFTTLFSADLLSSLGIPLFLDVLEQAPAGVRNNYLFALYRDDLHELLSSMFASTLLGYLQQVDQPIVEEIRVGTIPRNPSVIETVIVYNINQKLYSIGWIYAAGQWRMSNLNSLQLVERRSLFRKIDRNGLVFSAGYTFMPQKSDWKNMHLALGYYLQLHAMFAMVGELNYNSIAYKAGDTVERMQVMHVLIKPQVQIGIAFDALNMMVYAGLSAGVGFRLTSDRLVDPTFDNLLINRSVVIMSLGWQAGLEIGFGERIPFFIGLEGGSVIDYFSQKNLKTYNNPKKSYARGHYLRGYIKIRF
ncbi:hypothetical protein PVA45_00585 [Entomospira entomophila]|uniref:Uncharacterized protein n=1 Tax=Entomospira entomophila TaxID=2719988 RepID=A0A968KQT0_9SPIO|nr:hypothetical protein [Entomospira entomophilus]NIZ40018.1 hypothetical protein [Entomospira entomophilus]WDI35578.1 hypothetical protein PVA45_00585 [Entomospira entomophilus]